jgi:superfamily I DNA/RNA helicase
MNSMFLLTSRSPSQRSTLRKVVSYRNSLIVGLEWPVVFIPGLYQGSIPHSKAEDTDEERRLLYVAMTRAQGLLYMSYPTKGSTGGTGVIFVTDNRQPQNIYVC